MEKANIQIEMLDYDDNRVIDVELLRREVFHLKIDSSLILKSYPLINIKNRRTIPFALIIDDKIVAGCYVSGYGETLMVDYLFVTKSYRNTGLRLGRVLLNYILESKQEIEEYFHHALATSKLAALDNRAKHVYEDLGYQYSEENGSAYMVKKI